MYSTISVKREGSKGFYKEVKDNTLPGTLELSTIFSRKQGTLNIFLIQARMYIQLNKYKIKIYLEIILCIASCIKGLVFI